MKPIASSLRIGGLTQMTTVDYPGELSAIVFCQGCPWRCRYCHNGHLLSPRKQNPVAWSDIRTFLEARIGLLDAVVFSGGEPTLQSALIPVLAETKSMGFKIGLHTAGPYPERLKRLLPLVDWVGLDIKALPSRYPAITGIPRSGERAWDSLRVLLEADVQLQVRTTVPPNWGEEQDIAPLVSELRAAGVAHPVLQPCRTDSILDPSLATSEIGHREAPQHRLD